MNRWLHVAVVYDRFNTAHLYLNGQRRNSIAVDKPAHVRPVWIEIGGENQSTTDYWHGRLAHVAVYPRALSGRQIQNHYDQRKGGGAMNGT